MTGPIGGPLALSRAHGFPRSAEAAEARCQGTDGTPEVVP